MQKLYVYILSKFLALKRRLHIIVYKVYNPYPTIPKNLFFSPSDIIKENCKLEYNKLNYLEKKKPHSKWKKMLRRNL